MRQFKFLAISIFALFLFSCNSDEVNGPGSKSEIKNWANTEVIDAIESLGFEIHEGNNPPNINGSYSLKTRILDATNVPNDWAIGTTFYELRFTLSDQDNDDLVIGFDATEHDASGVSTGETITVIDHGLNSYITGTGNNFTAFFKVSETKSGYTATLIYAITGTKTENGFTNFRQGLVMLDDGGSPTNIFIRNNEGRIFSDDDGLVSGI